MEQGEDRTRPSDTLPFPYSPVILVERWREALGVTAINVPSLGNVKPREGGSTSSTTSDWSVYLHVEVDALGDAPCGYPAQSRNICKGPCSRGGKQTEGQGEGSLKAATLRCGPSGHRTEASSGPGTQSTLLWKPAEWLLDTQRPQCLGNTGLGNHKGLYFPSQTKI